MPDLASELKERILEAIDREVGGLEGTRGADFGAQVLNVLLPFGTPTDFDPDVTFATGFDGSVTLVPGLWDLSEWDGGDTWVD